MGGPRGRRRRLGQCFLIDESVSRHIVALLNDAPARVMEIGPGQGALTVHLLERFERVMALEVDADLIPGLRPLAQRGLEVHHEDALKTPLEPLLEPDAPWQLASNLPYSVGSAILRRVLPLAPLITRVVIMVQREVAARIVATANDREHGLLALERAAYGSARLAFDVPPSAFRPRPKVWSSVVVLDLEPTTHPDDLLKSAFRLAGHALTKARKTLSNAAGAMATREQLEAAGLDLTSRPGTISLEQWIALATVVGDSGEGLAGTSHQSS